MSNQNTGLSLQEVEDGQDIEWKDTVNCSPTYKSYWAPRKSTAVRDGIYERHQEYVNRQSSLGAKRMMYSLNSKEDD
jgi:hypothetical protein